MLGVSPLFQMGLVSKCAVVAMIDPWPPLSLLTHQCLPRLAEPLTNSSAVT